MLEHIYVTQYFPLHFSGQNREYFLKKIERNLEYIFLQIFLDIIGRNTMINIGKSKDKPDCLVFNKQICAVFL